MFVIWFFIVFSSSPLNQKFHRPSNVSLFYSINGLLKDTYVFDCFLSRHHLSKMWIVGSLLKNADGRGRKIMCARTLTSLLVLVY